MDKVTTEQEHKQRVREQFGATAQEYVVSEKHRSGYDIGRLVELAEPESDDVALDIATGGGHTALALAPHVRHVVASDVTPKMLEAAEAFIGGNNVTNVSFELAEAERLPFDDASFEIVSCRIAPHHFADVPAFCREVARVLKPSGRFVLEDSFSPEDDELDRFINEIEWRRDRTHVRSYRIPEWTAWIEEAGLAVDVVEAFERRHEFDSWTARSRMPEDEKRVLKQLILDAPDRVKQFFSIEIEDGRVKSFADHKFLLRARRLT